jgi:transposase
MNLPSSPFVAMAISTDLKTRIITLSARGFASERIASLLDVSPATVSRTQRSMRVWGTVDNPFKGVRGRKRLISRKEMQVLIAYFLESVMLAIDFQALFPQDLAQETPTAYLDEYATKLEEKHGKKASLSTISRTL